MKITISTNLLMEPYIEKIMRSMHFARTHMNSFGEYPEETERYREGPQKIIIVLEYEGPQSYWDPRSYMRIDRLRYGMGPGKPPAPMYVSPLIPMGCPFSTKEDFILCNDQAIKNNPIQSGEVMTY